ncbi:MAG: amylo-alpha-1,6-glucosidase [Chloroflexi bacterium]|nr:amylo-alpha-1,6-glucosidase [Chloroflexota bacterium]
MLERTVLKENQICLVTEPYGDIAAGNIDGQGLYFHDTRFLSLYELRVQGSRPRLLSSAGEYNFMTNLQLANEALELSDGQLAPARSISIRRNRFIQDGLHERIGLLNYNPFPARLVVQFTFGSDFRDMFEVRGYARPPRRGQLLPPEGVGNALRLKYLGIDEVERQTAIVFETQPSRIEVLAREPELLGAQELPGLSGHGDPRQEVRIRPPMVAAIFELTLPPGEPRSITLHIYPRIPGGTALPVGSGNLEAAFVAIRQSYRDWEAQVTRIETDNELVNALLDRALHDLRMLTDHLPTGLLPSAGIPWFSVPFGRDSLITSIQTLVLRPDIAYGTLRFLAEHQGARVDDWRDEEPGKILHEVRLGELAAIGQVPHTPYYGSVDSTPLFLVALGELLDWTDDWAFARQMEPHVSAALEWIDRYGDLDGDGFVEYHSRSASGIRNQGWKDSRYAISHRDGRPAEPPIALAEVQGYVFDARMRMSRYFERLGQPARAAQLRQQAAELQQRFEAQFWLADEQYYALALDGQKQPVPSVASNPGHCLWSGLLGPERVESTAQRLMADDMRSGWGVRTLSAREPTYNPMSYHNGSVWPHDSALVAAGLKRQGLDEAATRLIGEVLDAAMRMPLYRLPELYCGFGRDRRYHSLPAQYPVSCSPQAWAAGSVFLMLQTLLGLQPRLAGRALVVRPLLPPLLNRVRVRGLRVGQHRVDLEVVREHGTLAVHVGQSDDLQVVVQEPSGAQVVP